MLLTGRGDTLANLLRDYASICICCAERSEKASIPAADVHALNSEMLKLANEQGLTRERRRALQ